MCCVDLSHAVTVVLSRLYESWAPKQSDIYDTARLDLVAYKTLPGWCLLVIMNFDQIPSIINFIHISIK